MRAQTKTVPPAIAPLPAQYSGWPLEAAERGDFLHRVRVFPPEVRDWREEIVSRLMTSAAPGRKGGAPSRDSLRLQLDDGIVVLREVHRILSLTNEPLAPSEASKLNAAALRVLSRLGPYRDCGFEMPAATPLESVPPNLRATLPALLAGHGESVCKPEPSCGACELRKLCGFYRAQRAKEAAKQSSLLTIDLFAGAGGLSEGFRRAGFLSVAASDLNDVAMKTYRFNHPEMPGDAVMTRDIRELSAADLKQFLDGRRLDVLIGAPPCQGFSSVGKRSKKTRLGYRTTKDERNFLFEYLVDLALKLKPPLFLMENVPGMETAKTDDLSFLEAAAKRLEAGGYRTAIWRLQAVAYGVPQVRRRCFLVGAAKSVPLPMLPSAEYRDPKNDQDLDALDDISFEEATFDLPPREANSGTAVDLWARADTAKDRRFLRYLRKFRLTDQSRLVWNHFVRYHNERDLELYALLSPGEDSVHAIERHGRGDLMRYRRDVFDDKYYRLRANKPSKTIVAHLAKDGNGFIHPTQTRDISIREAARLQSFPDEFVFCGSPSDQWVQIGNAVPPVLAEAIAKSFRRVLEMKESK